MRTRTVKTPPMPIRPRAANDTLGRRADRVPLHDAPEAPLVVSFVGLTRSEQRAALAGFPGGRRFILADEAA